MNKIVPAVVIKSKFITSSNDSKFKDYLNYMDRKNTHSFENDFENYQDYQDYMSNSEKSTGIFTLDKDSLTEDEKIQLKDIFKESQENKSVLWQDVISFDNDWLRECGILKNDFLDEKKLKQATRNAMTEMLKKEGMEDSALWSGAIHYNTDNIHIHVATVQVKDFRERGKRKQKSIDVMKSKVANTLLDRSKENQKLNEFIRERVVNTKRQDNMISLKNRVLNRELVNQFKKIHSMLPEDKRLWQYSMNGIVNVRPEIDKFTQLYIEKHFKNEFKEFNKQLEKEVEIYKRTYGDNSRAEQYRETKMNDLYKRMGNTVLKEIKQYDSDLQSAAFKKNSALKKIKVNKELNEVFYRMDRAMNDNLDHYKNQREFERLQQEKEYER
jgi:hypothetical protein